MVVESEGRGFFHTNSSRADPAIRQSRCGDFRGALVLLPNANFRRELQLLAHPPFFECRHDDNRITRARKYQREKPLAHPPANAREVIERSPRRDEQRVVLRLQYSHQSLSVLEPFAILVGSNWMNSRAQRLKAGERFGERIGFGMRICFGERREPCDGQSGAALQESSARRLSGSTRSLFSHGREELYLCGLLLSRRITPHAQKKKGRRSERTPRKRSWKRSLENELQSKSHGTNSPAEELVRPQEVRGVG